MSTNPQARCVQGNILGHLVQLLRQQCWYAGHFSGRLGDLYFISLLGVPQLAAAVGFSGMLFFLAASRNGAKRCRQHIGQPSAGPKQP